MELQIVLFGLMRKIGKFSMRAYNWKVSSMRNVPELAILHITLYEIMQSWDCMNKLPKHLYLFNYVTRLHLK